MSKEIQADETAADGPQRERHVIIDLGAFEHNSGADWYFRSPTRQGLQVLSRTVTYEEPIVSVEEDTAELGKTE